MVTKIKDYKKSEVLIGEQLKNLQNYISNDRKSVVIVTDINVYSIYNKKFPKYPVIIIETGEKIKTQKTVDYIVEELLKLNADRQTFLIGIGGGIVCDITGFVASIFMRGIDFGYVSTTLLSQVDASIGGKTGINFKGFKNMIGVFNQPKFVLCDINMLKTLPDEELKSGLGEIIKHAIISDSDMCKFIEENFAKIFDKDLSTIQYLIRESVQTKTVIVTKDEKEKSERKKLNLGHTIGHAIESISGMPHGFAVAIGLIMAAKISFKMGYCNQSIPKRISKLVSDLNMKTDTDIETEKLIKFIMKDKKRNDNSVEFIFIRYIGDVFIKKVTFEELQNLIESVR